MLVVGTDEALIGAVGLPSGALADDVTVVFVRQQ